MMDETAKTMIALVADWVEAALQPSVLQMHVSTISNVVQASSFNPAALSADAA